MPTSNVNGFIAKLTKGGGPPPEFEFLRILEEANAAGNTDRVAWFPTRKFLKDFPDSTDGQRNICIILPSIEKGRGFVAIIGEVITRTVTEPDDPTVSEFYDGHEGFKAWWKISNPNLRHYNSLDDLPGISSNGKTAADTFNSPTSITCWEFSKEDVAALETANEPSSNWAEASQVALPRQKTKPLSLPTARNAKRTTSMPSESNATGNKLPDPEIDLFGVDFSGGVETAGQGNPKIWIAQRRRNGCVTLACGTDGPTKFGRKDLPTYIAEHPGQWVLDFPFGVAKGTAEAIFEGEKPTWERWLKLCSKAESATTLRDQAKLDVKNAGGDLKWAKRRVIDSEQNTTWFPLFEQLYRQTVNGARDVLHRLDALGRDRVCVFPFHKPASGCKSFVTEGFPGITIEKSLGCLRWGYKGKSESCRDRRQLILDKLRQSPYCLKIGDADATRALEDSEGDAVDALVLLVAAWLTSSWKPDNWERKRSEMERNGTLVEGWFPLEKPSGDGQNPAM